jgi:hypothetical protein
MEVICLIFFIFIANGITESVRYLAISQAVAMQRIQSYFHKFLVLHSSSGLLALFFGSLLGS